MTNTRKSLNKERKFEGQNFRYHGYALTKRVLKIRKKVYKKDGWKLRTVKKTFQGTKKKQYLCYVRKGK